MSDDFEDDPGGFIGLLESARDDGVLSDEECSRLIQALLAAQIKDDAGEWFRVLFELVDAGVMSFSYDDDGKVSFQSVRKPTR
jgi:hypothetical protein